MFLVPSKGILVDVGRYNTLPEHQVKAAGLIARA